MEVNSQEDNLSNFYQHPAIPQNITNFFPDISSQDNPSSIYKNTTSTFTVHNSEMIEFLKNAGFPYPNFNKPEEKRDIPKIKISKFFFGKLIRKINNNTSIIKEDFEKAIKTKDFEILYYVIRSYMFSLLKKEVEIINFSKDNLTDIIKIINIGIKDIIDGISKCENLIPITMFIKKIFVEKKISDKELSKMIYDVFNDLYERKGILETFEIKFNKDEIKEIVDFYKNKK